MLKAPFRRCKHHQIAHTEQTVNSAASNIVTHVSTAVTVYPVVSIMTSGAAQILA